MVRSSRSEKSLENYYRRPDHKGGRYLGFNILLIKDPTMIMSLGLSSPINSIDPALFNTMKTRIFRLPVIAAVCGLVMFSQANADDNTLNVDGKAHPRIVLERPVKPGRVVRGRNEVVKPVQGVSGLELIGLLGKQINALAAHHNLAPAELSSVIERDASLKANKDGVLYYVCPPMSASQAALAAATATPAKGPPFPTSQTFKLHSNPTSTKVIYLDFKGHTTTGTQWNTSFGKVVTPIYDTDGNPGSFSETEHTNMQEIWQRISEEFAPFNVDVTTEDPGTAGIVKATGSDKNYGQRVCIGGSDSDWLHDSAGGVSYLNTFGSSKDTPCFVFTKDTGNNTKFAGEAGAHELGHTFGLNHQGQTNGTEYYAGQGDWAPIMGVGYDKKITQWSKGEYPLANNKEDEIAMIAAYVPYRADKAGNYISAAVDLAGTTFNVSDIIEKRADVDFYHINAGPGSLNFAVTGATPEANLAAKLSLYDGSGKLLLTASPDANFGATLSDTVVQGTYYVAVEGASVGSVSKTGFSDYGSLGQYTLTGDVAAIAGLPPIAVATSSAPVTGIVPLTVNFSSLGSYDPDGSITKYIWYFGDGTTSVGANPFHTYTKPGYYTAGLVVFDDSGLSGTTTINIDAQSVNGPAGVHVEDIKLSLYKSWIYGYYAKAVVVVKDQDGNVVPNAAVAATWSGVGTGSFTVSTNAAGAATIWSDSAFSNKTLITSDGTAKPKTQLNRGTFTFTVTGITKTNLPYQAAFNKITSASVTTP